MTLSEDDAAVMPRNATMQKSLDRKLAAIHADPSGSKEFILADAKDADMAFGIGAPGKSPEMHAGEVRMRTLAEYREQIRQIVRQGLVDIMLMSASSNDLLTIDEGLFENSHVTPAARANDASDIFAVRGGRYIAEAVAAVPHARRSTTFNAATSIASRANAVRGANLGLVQRHVQQPPGRRSASRSKNIAAFGWRPSAKGFRHFLEVFDPNCARRARVRARLPHFINDSIARTLAGVAQAGRPVFLKIVYHGPQAMEELVAYDPHLVVGILGGGSRHDLRRVQADRRGAEIRCARGAVRPQDQQRRMPIGVCRIPAADRSMAR